MKWRKWNNLLHRDLGYLAVGLTIVFAVSGILLNHINDWSFVYKKKVIELKINPIKVSGDEEIAGVALKQLSIEDSVISVAKLSPDVLKILLKGSTPRANILELNLQSGDVRQTIFKDHFMFHYFKFLHLNKANKIWTFISDIYGFVLLFLAISGLFILKGKNGIKGRGAWLATTGVLIPVVFLLLYGIFN
ncbi:MAG: PepSY-associated TM helix domain-containing protein [Calditrichaceae bacterium]